MVQYFLKRLSKEIGKQVKGVSPQAMNLLISQPWQGNVRELKNCLERGMILCKNQVIASKDLVLDQVRFMQNHAQINVSIPPEGISLDEVESFLIKKALSMAQGNQSKAAAVLKITRNTMRYRMEKYGIKPGA